MKFIKTISIILCLQINLQTLFAQGIHPSDSIHQAYFTSMTNMFANVDLSYVPSGVLNERGFSFINLTPFNGQINEESKSSILAFGLAYASITSMNVDSIVQLPNPIHYTNVIDTVGTSSTIIPIVGLHQKYHTIDSLAFENGLLAATGRNLSDIFPRVESPYNEHDLFLFAPVTHSTTLNSFSFIVDSNLFYSNTGKVVSSIEIDFGLDSGYVLVPFNQEIPVQYMIGGTKNIKIKLVYTDSTTYYSHFDIDVAGMENLSADGVLPDFTHYISSISGAEPADGRGGGTLNVYLACGHTQIEKPFIWAEAYNPTVRKINANLKTRDIVDRMSTLDGTVNDKTLYDHLRENGYDIIVIDYDNGADYLPRTSELIKEALRWINIQKLASGSNSKNVILGQSMGGVATALALKEMEVLSLEDHEVDKFIIFDSPMKGVNIPLSLQASLLDIAYLPVRASGRPLKSYVSLLNDIVEVYLLPATRTMVRYMVDYSSISDEPHLYDEFYTYLHDELGGPPEDCAILTITNGSRFGSSGQHNFSPGELILHSEAHTLTVIAYLGLNLPDPEEDLEVEEINTLSVVQKVGMIVWAVGTSSDIDIKAWAVQPNEEGDSSLVYQSNILIRKIWFGIGDTLVLSKLRIYSKNIPPVDGAPGGFFGDKDKGFLYNEDDLGSLAPTVFKIQTFCFTPTGSVLNYQGTEGEDWADDVFRNYTSNVADITENKTFGVESYVSNSETRTWGTENTYNNTAHTWFTNEISKFVLYHLKGSDELEVVTNLTSGILYNFGESEVSSENVNYEITKPYKTSEILDHSLTANNTILGVNINSFIGLTPSPYSPDNLGNARPNSHFIVNIGPICDASEPVELVIENNALFQLGDGLTRSGGVHVQDGHIVRVKTGGVLRIKKGGTFKLLSGATLILENGATLIIEDNSTLINEIDSKIEFHEGASIDLLGENAILDLRGELHLFENADFTPGYEGFSSGKIIIRNPTGTLIGENGSKFQIIGQNQNDPMLTITEYGQLHSSSNMALLRFSNCTVTLRNAGANIISLSPFSSPNVKYIIQDNEVLAGTHPEIYLYNKSIISSSDFIDVKLTAQLFTPLTEGGYFVNLNNTDFSYTFANEETQVSLKGGGVNLFMCNFIGFKKNSLILNGLTNYSQIQNCSFVSHVYYPEAIAIQDNSAAELYLWNSSFSGNKNAIIKANGKLRLKCNDFYNSFEDALWIKTNCYLDLGLNAGYNNFTHPIGKNVKLTNVKGVYLNNGYNTFSQPSGSQPAIYGTIKFDSPYAALMLAQKNKWNDANTVPPSSSFSLFSSITGVPIGVIATSPQTATCGAADPDKPLVIFNGSGNYLPLVNLTGLANPMRLDSALNYALGKTELWDSTSNDLLAIALFHNILTTQFTQQQLQDSLVMHILDFTFQEMKRTVEHSITNSLNTPAQNESAFNSSIQLYVDVLNILTQEDTITNSNYVRCFNLELDKAHLFRMLGNTLMALDIIKNIDLCPLDSLEQVIINEWKFLFEEELNRKEKGWLGYGTQIIFTDVSNYDVPNPTQISNSYFGSIINSPSSVTFRSCNVGNMTPENGMLNDSTIFRIYPNPSQGYFSVDYGINEEQVGELIIFNLEGREIERFKLNSSSNSMSFEIKNLATGMYVYRFIINDLTKDHGKIVITN
jgi:hypothetical protein